MSFKKDPFVFKSKGASHHLNKVQESSFPRNKNTILLTASTTLLVCSALGLLYQQNAFGIRQNAINIQRESYRKIDDMTVKNEVNPQRIKQTVMANDHDGLTKKGAVVIPKLLISLPIYNKPYDKKALLAGANQLTALNNGQETDAKPGNGNFMLVAHNYNDGKKMFSALQQYVNQDSPYLVNGTTQKVLWLQGQKIYIANDDGIFEYEIDYQQAIKASDTAIRQDTENSVINIITCLEPSDDYRILTHGNLVSQYSWDNVDKEILRYFDSTAYPYNF